MIVLLLKASIIIAVLLIFYKLFLEKESFFAVNRAYLMACLILAFTLPFISLPQLVKDQGLLAITLEEFSSSSEEEKTSKEIITQELAKDQTTTSSSKEFLNTNNENTTLPSLSTSASKDSNSEVLINEKQNKTEEGRGLLFWISVIYLFGIFILALNFILQIANVLFKVYKSKDKVHDTDNVIINTPAVQEPCSFFNYIFIHPDSYDFDTYEQIIAHEKIHVKQLHTLDLLLSELAIIILWFNPLIWMFRKEVEKNIEYQTDDLLISGEDVKKDQYQMNLLKVATYNKPLAITTNYNQSLIKQRILKMSTTKSNPYSSWKYAFLAPIIFILLLIINKPITMNAQSDAQTFTKQEEIIANTTEDNTTVEKETTQVSKENTNKQEVATSENENQDIIKTSISKDSIKEPMKVQVDLEKLDEADQVKIAGNLDNLEDLENVKEFNDLEEDEKKKVLDILENTGNVGSSANSGDAQVKDLEDLDEGLQEKILNILSGLDTMAASGSPIVLDMDNLDGETELEVLEFLDEMNILKDGKNRRKLENRNKSTKVEDCKKLLKAVKEKNTKSTELILKSVNPNCTCEKTTALIEAVKANDFDVARILVESGADPFYTTPDDDYAMHHARLLKNKKMIDLLKAHEQ